jgi:hypothetical protein
LRRDLGDFQTPPDLVARVFAFLRRRGILWRRVLEPTCGRGHFLAAASIPPDPSVELVGIEIQPAYVSEARSAVPSARVLQADLFQTSLSAEVVWKSDGPLLVVGNPPWVTAAELGRLESDNGPPRQNVQGRSGLEARTGRSNFDLAEAVWIKLIRELAPQNPTIALLCKATVARNLLERMEAESWPVRLGSFHRIDARLCFGASVEAGLLCLQFGPGARAREISVYSSLEAEAPSHRFGLRDGLPIADLDAFAAASHLFGRSARVWRQGIKHDAAAVLELTREGGHWRNGLGEAVSIEPEWMFPLLKARDLARLEPPPERALIVPQFGLSDDPERLSQTAPRLWQYLNRHSDRFAARKSSIYRNRAPFSIFGVGPYTFTPSKVAVSGLHRSARFRAIGPRDGRPVVFDDTSYFLPCSTAEEAEAWASGLNGDAAQALIRALGFAGMKRPITKNLLQHIDLDRMSRESLGEDSILRAIA